VAISDTFDFVFHSLDTIIWAAVGIAGLIASWRLAMRRRRAESWPMILGHVERAEVNNEDTAYSVTLAYSYEVNGEFFSGFYSKPFKMFRFAEEFVSMNRGQQLFIRYDPEKPEKSVLRDKDNAALLTLH
jgi:hypothetical protein